MPRSGGFRQTLRDYTARPRFNRGGLRLLFSRTAGSGCYQYPSPGTPSPNPKNDHLFPQTTPNPKIAVDTPIST